VIARLNALDIQVRVFCVEDDVIQSNGLPVGKDDRGRVRVAPLAYRRSRFDTPRAPSRFCLEHIVTFTTRVTIWCIEPNGSDDVVSQEWRAP